jgi:NADH-quinone oxidoreductase subunit G
VLGSSLKDPNSTEQFKQIKGVTRIVLASHEGPLVAGAQVVLPITSWAENEGTYVNSKGMAQVSEQAILPQGRCLPAFKWVAHLARALGKSVASNTLAEARALYEAPPAAPAESNQTAGATP